MTEFGIGRLHASYLIALAIAFLLVFTGRVQVAYATSAGQDVQSAPVAQSIDLQRTGSLVLSCEFDRAPVAGLSFALWRVADVDQAARFEAAPEFADCSIDFDDLGSSTEWDAAAKTLFAAAAKAKVQSCAEGTSSADGTVSFTELVPGLYLVSAAEVAVDGYRYDTAPCLISVPHAAAVGDGWDYDVVAFPKMEQQPISTPDSDSGDDGQGKVDDSASSGDEASGNALARFLQTGDGVPLIPLALACCLAFAVAVAAHRSRSSR